MQRGEVYQAINSERAYQQAQGKPDQHSLQEWIMGVRHYLHHSGMADLYDNQPRALEQLRKAIAVGIAALEQYGCKPREGYEPEPQPAMPQPVTDLDIMVMVESVLVNDAVVNVLDVHTLMLALRDHYEMHRRPVAQESC